MNTFRARVGGVSCEVFLAYVNGMPLLLLLLLHLQIPAVRIILLSVDVGLRGKNRHRVFGRPPVFIRNGDAYFQRLSGRPFVDALDG